MIDKYFYYKDELLELINIDDKYTYDQINNALTELMFNSSISSNIMNLF